MTQPTIAQLHNLTDRAAHGLTADEQQRLRDGIDALHAELDRHADAEAAERGLARLLDLVRDFLDDNVCDLDAYGYCVAHSWACSGVRCPHARARDVLAALDGEPQPEDLTGAYQPDPPIGCLLPGHASPAEPGPAATRATERDCLFRRDGCRPCNASDRCATCDNPKEN